MRTCPAASRVQLNPPTPITLPPEALQLTTRAQRQILHSPLTPNADAYCYDEEPWHSWPYTLFPTLGHAHLCPRRHCPLLPILPSHAHQHGNSQLREFGWHATVMWRVGKGHRACKWTSMVRLLVRRPLGHANGPQGSFVCTEGPGVTASTEAEERCTVGTDKRRHANGHTNV